MRIAMLASECEPYAKTGGLADVVDALARALGRRGHEVDVYLPRYRDLRMPREIVERHLLLVPQGEPPGARQDVGDAASVDLLTAPVEGYRLRLVDHPGAFDRAGFYGEGGRDYPDNAGRFALLGRTALEAMRREERAVDILHGHDWQAGPGLLLLRQRYRQDPLLAPIATVMSCHNLAYHGWTPRPAAWRLDLPPEIGSAEGVDLLREAVRAADMVNTVSPTYALESRTPEHGAGLDDLLRELGERYVGILNGLDTELWDPAADAALVAPFSLAAPEGKAACKADLLARHGLSSGVAERATGGGPWDARGAPLVGMVGRLDPQKGFDIVAQAAPGLVRLGVRLIVLGTGDPELVAGLQAVAAARPKRVAVLDRFDRDEARRIYAGCDLFLMPSRFEPSGQGQLIALRYGTLPVVRSTGGLADTVTDADLEPERGNGFAFPPETEPVRGLADALRRALAAYRDADRWQRLQRRAMAEDHSWTRPAAAYEALYERAVEFRRERMGAGA
ncbi:MAG: glycogen synthase [Candidatus Limnocylindrales bacterium]